MTVKDQPKLVKKAKTYVGSISNIKLFFASLALLLLSVILLLLALMIQHRANKSLIVPTAGVNINTPVSMGLVSMTVTKVSFSDGQPGFSAPANMHYAIVDFVVKNNADTPIDVLPSSDTYLKDSSGSVSYLTPYELTRPFRAGKLLPGEEINGQLSYIVAKSGGAKLYVDSIWSGGVVPFKVQ